MVGKIQIWLLIKDFPQMSDKVRNALLEVPIASILYILQWLCHWSSSYINISFQHKHLAVWVLWLDKDHLNVSFNHHLTRAWWLVEYWELKWYVSYVLNIWRKPLEQVFSSCYCVCCCEMWISKKTAPDLGHSLCILWYCETLAICLECTLLPSNACWARLCGWTTYFLVWSGQGRGMISTFQIIYIK